jgi:hypothetical protein
MEGYEAAQICLNGHLINQMAQTNPDFNQDFCTKCGSATIWKCQQCDSKIRGFHHTPGVLAIYTIDVPGFCYSCGKPYPWTEKRLAAAQELVNEMEKLTENDRRILTESVEDLVHETPNTPTAVIRFKKLAAKAGSAAAEGLKSLLVDVLSEAVKKQIWPS